MSYGHGFGKIILFGEHFVVYGMPAIVSAVSQKITAHIEPAHAYTLFDETQKFSGVKRTSWEESRCAIKKTLTHLGVTKPLKITMRSNSPLPNGGLGMSAASLVAIARAASRFFNLNLTNTQINHAAYEGEKVYHGMPSGIDNTAATYGGMFVFEKGQVKKIALEKPIPIVLIDSGERVSSKSVIEDIHKIQENLPLEQYKEIFVAAHRALHAHDLKTLGRLMNENHKLLQEITASSTNLDEIVTVTRKAGALGAKMTGAGRGGLAIALAPDIVVQKKIMSLLRSRGYSVLETTLSEET